MLSSVFVALAVSLDSLGVGISYGIKKVKISLFPLVIVGVITMIGLSLSMGLGYLLLTVIPLTLAKIISAGILVTLGGWFCLAAYLDYRFPNSDDPTTIKMISIKSLGLVIKVFREPGSADTDNSGTIDPREAVFLGIALAMDAMMIGVTTAVSNTAIIPTVLITGIFSVIFMLIGICLGKIYGGARIKKAIKFVPGSILILLGLTKLV